MGVNSLPRTVTRHLNPGPSAHESSTLTTRLPSHPWLWRTAIELMCCELAGVKGRRTRADALIIRAVYGVDSAAGARRRVAKATVTRA